VRNLMMLVFAACSGAGAESDTAEDGGACGAVTSHTVTVRAKVVNGTGQPVAGASVVLEERAWEPGARGQGTSGEDGEVILRDLSITSVERCWGTALDYALVAKKDAVTAEEPLNSSLFNLILEGGADLDLRGDPLVLP